VVRFSGEGDESPAGARQLAAYVEWSGGTGDGSGAPALKHFLAQRLPEYMLPRHVVLLDRLPVSANGKIDAQALPPPAALPEAGAGPRQGPRSDTEHIIFQAWARVLQAADFGISDNFFDLGGDSVLATRLLRELNAALPLFKLEMHEIFEHMTVETMAALYLRRPAPAQQGDPPAPLAAPPGVDRLAALAEHDKAAMLADLQAAQECIASIELPSRAADPSAPRELLLTGATGWIGTQVLGELLRRTLARVHCLVRSTDTAQAQASLFGQMRQRGIAIEPGWAERVEAVAGDLDQAQLGMPADVWEALCSSVDGIYHLGASLNILASPRYAGHRQTNVMATLEVARLAMARRLKPVFFLSPMTVSRRYRNGEFAVLHQELAHDADGLMTGYAQSKWAAEQVLLAAAARGLPLKIYRCSHALPSTQGHVKETDTYVNLLRVACRVPLIPDWEDSRLNGLPVDALARILVENTLAGDGHRGIVHIDNRDPLDLKSILGLLLPDGGRTPFVPRQQWLAACQAVAAEMPGVQGSLANLLFAHRASDTSVERMLHAHPLDLGYFSRRGEDARLAHLTPPSYWHMLRQQLGAMA
jgi:thioester reductase-like protein